MDYIKRNKNNIIIITSLAIPVIIENILQTLIGTVDTYFAGSISDNAIASIGISNLIINLFIVIFTAISVGTTAVISRNVGKKDKEKTDEAISQSIILGMTVGLLVGLINYIFYKPILLLSGATSEILETTKNYYLMVAVPIIFLCLSTILSSCLRATKDTKTPMIATTIANIINIILNIIFINMNMGLLGLGLATSISRMINMLILFRKLKKNNINIRLNSIKRDTFISILKIGMPAGAEKLIMRLGQLVYNGMIISIGVSSYVAHNIAGNIESYTYIPAMGFGVATATLVGISIGEGKCEKTKELVYLADVITTIFMIFMGVLLFLFAPNLAVIFTDTKEIQNMVISVLRLISLFQCFIAMTQIFTSALQGAGDTKFPMYTTLIGIWGIRVVIGYILGVLLNLGLIGVWFAYASDITLRSILLMIRFNSGKWKEIYI